ncbi:MAG: BBP7 family outer membrane beta-barrel protein [Planctomycetaceae bacterium]
MTAVPPGYSPPGYGPPAGSPYGGPLPPGPHYHGPEGHVTQDYGPGYHDPNVPYYGPTGVISTRVLQEPFWDENRPIEKFVGNYFRNGYFRLEYLNYEIDEPGNELLGAPIQGIANPTEPFPVFDFQIPPQFLGTARVVDLTDITFRDVNGVRGTIGVPLIFGAWEVSGWAMEQASDQIRPAIDAFEFIATSTLVSGQPATNSVFLYNSDFEARYTSDIWGLETVVAWHGFHWELFDPNDGLQVQPVIGLRFLSIQEQLRQSGTFFDPFLLQTPLVSVINSESHNNIAATILGARIEYVHKWFTLGAEPRIGPGWNRYRNHVTTENFRSFADGVIETQDDETVLTAVAEFQLYARVHVTEDFSLTVGYNVLWVPRMTRPHRNIFYNDNGPNAPPGIVVDSEIDELRLEGLTVGGELRFR